MEELPEDHLIESVHMDPALAECRFDQVGKEVSFWSQVFQSEPDAKEKRGKFSRCRMEMG